MIVDDPSVGFITFVKVTERGVPLGTSLVIGIDTTPLIIVQVD